jgi:hypothetical protein
METQMNFTAILAALKGSNILSSPRTTFIGVMMVLSGVASLLHIQINGVAVQGDAWYLIATGTGLIFAKDGATHSTIAQVEKATVVAATKEDTVKAQDLPPKP